MALPLGFSRLGSVAVRSVALTMLIVSSASAQQQVEAFLAGSAGYLQSPSRGETTRGFALSLALGGSALIVGPELLWHDGDHLRVRAFELAARLRQRRGRIHPHLVVSLGAYAWQTRTEIVSPVAAVIGGSSWTETTYASASLGAGLTLGSLDHGISVPVEGRWHRNLGEDDVTGSRSLIEVRVGVRLAW
jgi:hypothetical protein